MPKSKLKIKEDPLATKSNRNFNIAQFYESIRIRIQIQEMKKQMPECGDAFNHIERAIEILENDFSNIMIILIKLKISK